MKTEKAAWRLILVTFAVSWAIRLALAWLTGSFHDFDRRDMERAALSLAHTGTMADVLAPGVPSAWFTPGFVLTLGGIFRLFGDGALGEAVKVISCTAVSSLRCALTVWLAIRLGLSRAAILAIAALSIFWIGGLNTELQGDWDAPYTACALILLVWFTKANPFEQRTPQRALLMGAAWGLGAYWNPSLLAVLGGFMVRDFLIGGRNDLARFSRQSVCLVAGLFLVLLPWGIRNRITMGSWIFTRNGLGYNLSIAYRDGAHWSEPVNNHPEALMPRHPPGSEVSPFPFFNLSLRPEALQLGETEWDRMHMRRGLRWIAAHPSRSAVLFAEHVFYFWFPPWPGFYRLFEARTWWPYTIARWILPLLALAGWFRLRQLAPPVAQITATIVLTFPLVYYVVSWSSRYRMPIEWVLVFLAGVALGGAWDVFCERRHQHSTGGLSPL
jgi:hypothetical protein